MQTLIIDDEQPAIRLLSVFVKKVPSLKLQLATTNAFEGLELMNKINIDLLFLDIEMPDITGIELLQSLEKKPLVVFTTAYEKYALKGYELDIVDYLVKPIPFDRFLKAVNKVQKLFQNNQPKIISNQPAFLFVKSDYKTIKIPFQKILYIEGLKDYVKIYTQEKMIMTRLNLKGIEEKLPGENFVRIHRSYIAAFSKITSFQKSQISIGDKDLPIGDAYRKKVFDKLN